MGSFLDKPKMEKETFVAAGNGMRVGVSAMQGWRVDMEDAHSVVLGIPGNPTYSWFGVFDGHGGSNVSNKSADALLDHILATEEYKRDHSTPEGIAAAIRRGFLDMDEELRKLPEVQSGDDHSGSTAITVMVTPTHFIVGNCGDSRSILVRDDGVVELSIDHKPYNEGEQRRIEAAGGTVAMRRVNGDLAVSRALGDFVYKHVRDLPAEAQQVSAEPESKIVERSAAQDMFLVLACDGIWDVMSNDEVGAFIMNKTREGCDDLAVLASALIDNCLALNSRDNMSVIIVAFQGVPRPTPEAALAFNAREAARVAAGGAGGEMNDDGERAGNFASYLPPEEAVPDEADGLEPRRPEGVPVLREGGSGDGDMSA